MHHRGDGGELVRTVEPLSDTQAREKLVPSLTTPISLIKHCAAAERIWFQRTLAGMSINECNGHAVGGDGSFHVADDETLADVITEYVAACRFSKQLAANRNLDDTAEHHLVGTVNLRFIYLGMIAEVARHAGHADILAEQIRRPRNYRATPPSTVIELGGDPPELIENG